MADVVGMAQSVARAFEKNERDMEKVIAERDDAQEAARHRSIQRT